MQTYLEPYLASSSVCFSHRELFSHTSSPRGVAFGTGMFDDENDEMLHVGEDYVIPEDPRTADTYHFYLDDDNDATLDNIHHPAPIPATNQPALPPPRQPKNARERDPPQLLHDKHTVDKR